MIESRSGDILAIDAEALVNTVNCVGVMGQGIALQFKRAFPENFEAYRAACARGEVTPGRMFVFETHAVSNPRYIINFPTKRHWRGKSRMEDIEAGLAALIAEIRQRGIRTVAVPPLASGLDWGAVRPRIEAAFRQLDGVQAIVFEPCASKRTLARAEEPPAMTAGRAALLGLMWRYLGGLMDPFVTLLEVHKRMYFMQEAGEPLRLKYVQAPYGPYAENLRHVLLAIEGHYITGYEDGGEGPDKELSLVPGTVDDATAFLEQHAETRARFDRVAELVDGFETPFGLELLATTHWIATRRGLTLRDDVTAAVYAWNERKRQFSPRQIGLAIDVITTKKWLVNQRAHPTPDSP